MGENGGWLGSLMQGGNQQSIQQLLATIRQQQMDLNKKPDWSANFLDAKNFLGGNYGFATNEYKKLYEGGDPAIKEMTDLGIKRLGIQSQQAKKNIEEQISQGAIRGTGANLFNNLYQEQALGIEDITNKGALQQSQVKQMALSQLMGAGQWEGGMRLNVAQQNEATRQYEKTFQENVRQFGLEYALKEKQLALAEEEASGGFGGFLGDLFGSAIGFATGGIGAGFGSWIGKKLFG